MNFTYQEVKNAISDGLLSFPITDFDANGAFDAESYRERLEWLVSHDISAVFVAGGTGEFFNLTLDEYRAIVSLAIETVGGKLPVIAGTGLSIGAGQAYAKAAEEAGADGILLMPPYLTECPQDGLMNYAHQICDSISINVIYYNRGNGLLEADTVQKLADACPNLIGLKDGKGDIQAFNKIIKTVGDRLVYIGGVPTAEIFAEAYMSIGVNTYSSAVFNFVPEMALKFYRELRKGNKEVVREITQSFFIPFIELRDNKKGYAVSLIKEGADIIGKPAGNVRSPLVMPISEERERLNDLIEFAKSI
ncbi:5-dehydro-4-deoxyglucarate dehydratase [Chromohalobacter sp. 296-RDG]|uniref:5-dehydro-4-deoxyglucarate dehydratase n=1 Tax=Chromohalobacter sp. 296-RDG TaxID=2994062 RepID=UPI0024698050|nr:5-dehydro-4-deoxyglucarate dehydratase [Chromohalobacter sp. 296-RDG]